MTDKNKQLNTVVEYLSNHGWSEDEIDEFLDSQYYGVQSSFTYKEAELKKLYVDIEVSPNEGYFWRPGKQYMGPHQISRERNIIMVQYAWEGATKPEDVTVLKWDWKKWEDRDYNLLKEFSKIYTRDDISEIVTQNGISFDIPWIKGRLAILGLPPMPSIKQLDLKVLNARHMGFNSNKLDYLSKLFGGTGKIKMEYQDWIDIIHGDEEKLAKMEEYGRKDVLDMMVIEKRIAPYIPEARAHSLLRVDGGMCPHCKKDGFLARMQKRGYYMVMTGRKQRWYCNSMQHPRGRPRWVTDTKVERSY